MIGSRASTREVLLSQAVEETLSRLANGELPAPGGSAVGLTGSLAAALVCTVANASRASWQEAAETVAQAESLRVRLARLTASDGAAHAAARELLQSVSSDSSAASAEVTATEGERRNYALGVALTSAASVPLAMAEACADVAVLAAWASEECLTETRAEAVLAATLAAAGAAGAAHLVLVNLAVRGDDAAAALAREAAAVAEAGRARAIAASM
jgi:methenyltetrahydrofolate cyclohydrolase